MKQPQPVGERAAIYRRGRVWWVNLQVRGRQIRRSLKTRNEKEARRLAVAFEHEIRRGGSTESQRRTRPVTVREAVAALLKHASAEGRAPRTLTKYRGVLERLADLAEADGKPDLIDLDHAFVDDYRQRRQAELAAAKTIYNEVVLIRQLVNFALTRRLLPHDPLAGLKVREPKPTPQPCWTPDQVERILQAAAEPQRSIYTILAETGARIGEIKWLTWEDVDVGNNVIHIRPKPGWKTKTGNLRAIPMSLRSREIFERLPRHARWVFTAPPSRQHPDDTRQISERRLLKSLKRLLLRLKLKGHLHTFRHSFVSRAVMAGTPEAIIRQWVGHVDRDILKLYTHVADAQSQAAMRALNAPAPDQQPES